MRSLFFFSLIFFSIVSSVCPQVVTRNILSNHFSLEDVRRPLVQRADWKPYPQTAAEWKDRLPSNEINEIIKRGEGALGKEIPAVPATLFLEYVRTGDRSRYQDKSFARRDNLMDLVLAEAVEDKGRFSDAIANYVWAICEETYWGVPAHLSVQKARNGLPDVDDPIVELFGAETAATLALTDYLVGAKLDKISPLIRKRIYIEANRKILTPIKQGKRFGYLDPTKKVNNWNPWILSNVMMTELLLEPDEATRSANLYQYMQWLDIYLNGLGNDGGCDEGPSYWFAAGGAVFDALEILQSASGGKINIFNEPLIGKMASYIYKMHIADDYFVDFADADPKFSGDGLMLYRFGKDIQDETLSQFGLYLYSRHKNVTGEGFEKPRHLNDLLTIKELPAQKPDYIPSTDAWFSDIQVMTARTHSGLFLATHAGNNDESHNHNDVGDFIVYLGNEPVIIDAGRGNYTAKTFSSHRYELWFTQSQYHNLPIINGFGQLAGKGFEAVEVKHSSSDTKTSLFMNIAKAYPKDAGIDIWDRTVELDRSDDSVSVVDDVSLRTVPVSLQQVFMTVCEADISEPGTIKLTTASGKIVTLTYDQNTWSIAIDKPSIEGPEYSSFTSKWNNRSIQRILLTSKALKSKDQLKYVVSISKN